MVFIDIQIVFCILLLQTVPCDDLLIHFTAGNLPL